MANTLQITPFMHVRDLATAVAFLEDVLGFETKFRMREYAYLEREGAGMRVLERSDALVFAPDCGRFAYYIDVRDVDEVHAALKARLDGLPAGDVHGPADKGYGQRELIVRAPDGQLLVFGAAIAKQGPPPRTQLQDSHISVQAGASVTNSVAWQHRHSRGRGNPANGASLRLCVFASLRANNSTVGARAEVGIGPTQSRKAAKKNQS